MLHSLYAGVLDAGLSDGADGRTSLEVHPTRRRPNTCFARGGEGMCLEAIPIGGLGRWNWDGDAVVYDTTVPSQRPVVGGRRHYRIDVREFLVTEKNAVLRATLRDKVRAYANECIPSGADLFEARTPGAFDFRAKVIEGWVAREVRYLMKRGRDPWQFPEETLTAGSGDCEDLAFLIASLLRGAGVSGYHVRVALGEVRAGSERYDHAWVVYKNESGQWCLIDPLQRTVRPRDPLRRRGRGAPSARRPVPGPVRYVPSFLFNDDHLWVVVRKGNPGSVARIAARDWRRMSPKFAGDVHLSILERALTEASPEFMRGVRARFKRLGLVGPLIDVSDWIDVLNPSATPYDPRQHFDNGLISESWDLLENNAAAFRADRDDTDAFGSAAHAIADLYAHSSYMHFAWVGSGPHPHAKSFHPEAWSNESHVHDLPDYGSGVLVDIAFDFRRFTTNSALWSRGVDAGIARWNGKVISGRYAQHSSDRHGSSLSKLAESMCALPARFRRPELGALPHHSEIAVDDADWSPSHRLYEPGAYALQFELRFNTAVEHIRNLFETGVP